MGMGLLRVVSNRELVAAEQSRDARTVAPVVTSLAAHIRTRFEAARQARQPIEDAMLKALNERNGIYEADKLAQIRQSGGSEIFMMLTNVKCRAAEAWVKDVLMPAGDKPWTLDPTPVADLPAGFEQAVKHQVWEEMNQLVAAGVRILPTDAEARANTLRDAVRKSIQQEARDRCKRMEDVIADQLAEGAWAVAFSAAVHDAVTLKNGFLKGPVMRRRKALSWQYDADGQAIPVVNDVVRPEWYAPSPFDIYPAPWSRTLQDGDLIERHRLTRGDLVAMIGVPGYSETAIRAALDDYGRGGLRQWLSGDQQRATAEGRPNELLSAPGTIDALQYWGSVPGSLLLEWGMDASEIADPHGEYEVESWLVGTHVIKATLNPDPLGRRPYSKAGFDEQPGSFWQRGVPELMTDKLQVCNAAARAVVNNMAIASGPQVEVYADRLAPGQNLTEMYPWKIWQMQSDPTGTGNARAISFFQPQVVTRDLMAVYDKFSQEADDVTGIPAYTYGDGGSSGGAGSTASGLSMLMSHAAKGIKSFISNLDRMVSERIDAMYVHNMLYHPDPGIKGDLKVVPRGAASLMAKEQLQVRRTEFLNATANPIDSQITGIPGRAAVLREVAKSLEMDVDKIVPPADQLEASMRQQQAQQQPQPGQPRQPQPGQPQAPQTLDPAGNPAGGLNLFA